MSFAERSFRDILADLIAAYVAQGTEINDLAVGGILHSIFMAVAAQEQKRGEDLVVRTNAAIETAAYRSFGFIARSPVTAYGTVTVTASPALQAPLVIPVGTLFGVPGTTLQFLSTGQVTMPTGAVTAIVPVSASIPGKIANVRAGTVTQLITPLPGIVSVTNPSTFVTGADAETDAERAARFRDYVADLHRGTRDAIEHGALQGVVLDAFALPAERVTKVASSEGAGSVQVWVHGLGVPASPALVAAAQQVIDGYQEGATYVPGYRAAGIPVTVTAATVVPTVVQVLVRVLPGYTLAVVQPIVADAVRAVFNRLDIGEDLTINVLRHAIDNVAGVADLVLQRPTLNQHILPGQLATLQEFIPFGAVGQSTDSYIADF